MQILKALLRPFHFSWSRGYATGLRRRDRERHGSFTLRKKVRQSRFLAARTIDPLDTLIHCDSAESGANRADQIEDQMEPRRDPAKLSGFEHNLLRQEVFKIIKAKSFFRERITLASGRESDFYFNMKPSMFDPEGSWKISELLFDRLLSEKFDYVGGLALGAVPLVSNLAAYSHYRNQKIQGFFVRDKVKEHGTKLLIEGLAKEENLAGAKVVILDDVVTTGGSALKAVKAAQEAGAAVILVLALVDREEGGAETYSKANIRYESIFKASEFLNS
jgi:orotate phosphoribosyltransferase